MDFSVTNRDMNDLAAMLDGVFPDFKDISDDKGDLILFAGSEVLGHLSDEDKYELLRMMLKAESETVMAKFLLKNKHIGERYEGTKWLASLKRLVSHHRKGFIRKHIQWIPAHLVVESGMYSNDPRWLLELGHSVVRYIMARMEKFAEIDSKLPVPTDWWRIEAGELRHRITLIYHIEAALGNLRKYREKEPEKRQYMVEDNDNFYFRVLELAGITDKNQQIELLNKARHFTPLKWVADR